jgi:hypothetical protein
MKNLAVITVASLTFGCTTLRSIDGPPERIQQEIRAGHLVGPGDRVRIVTRDGTAQSFRVADVTSDGTLIGNDRRVAVGDIVALQERRTSWIKTGLLIGFLGIGLFDTRCSGDPCGDFGGGPNCCR